MNSGYMDKLLKCLNPVLLFRGFKFLLLYDRYKETVLLRGSTYEKKIYS